MTDAGAILPRGPVFDWSVVAGRGELMVNSIDAAGWQQLTTSGRAAIHLALRALGAPPGAAVGLPTYHCPTMVAPVCMAGMVPRFYAIGSDGLPDLARLDSQGAAPHALLVPHWFGHAQDLQAVRRWCDERGVALIEDCAHCYFGAAGARPVGQWGDWAIASISKFFAVPEAGLLVSGHGDRRAVALAPRRLADQIKAVVDVVDTAGQAGRMASGAAVLRALRQMRRRAGSAEAGGAEVTASATISSRWQDWDMGRALSRPLMVAQWIWRHSSRAHIAERRAANHALLLQGLRNLPGARLLEIGGQAAAPYALPLWVDDPEQIYPALRRAGVPAYRWDRVWPGTPRLDGDVGLSWSRHVLQLLCHQDLAPADVERIVSLVRQALGRGRTVSRPRDEPSGLPD